MLTVLRPVEVPQRQIVEILQPAPQKLTVERVMPVPQVMRQAFVSLVRVPQVQVVEVWQSVLQMLMVVRAMPVPRVRMQEVMLQVLGVRRVEVVRQVPVPARPHAAADPGRRTEVRVMTREVVRQLVEVPLMQTVEVVQRAPRMLTGERVMPGPQVALQEAMLQVLWVMRVEAVRQVPVPVQTVRQVQPQVLSRPWQLRTARGRAPATSSRASCSRRMARTPWRI